MSKSIKNITSALALFVALSLNSHSTQQINEFGDTSKVWKAPAVTVTSSRAIKGESPLPFSEIGKKEIQNRYVAADMPKLLSIMPSIIFTSQNGNGIGYSDINMRGFDQKRIAVMVNGIPQNDPEDHDVYWLDMPDLAGATDNIQVQRGAGMASYGFPSIGGAINVQTSTFANRKGLRVYSGYGLTPLQGANNHPADAGFFPKNRTLSKFSFEYASGLVDNQAFFAKFSRINSGGYRDNSWATLQSYYLSYANYGERLTTQVNFFGGPINDAMAYNGIPKAYIKDPKLRLKNYAWGWSYDSTGKKLNWAADRSRFETEEFSQPHFEILNAYKLSDELTINSSLFYYQGDGYFDGDFSWGDDDINGALANKYEITDENKVKDAFTRGWVRNKQIGWIPKITYTTENNTLSAGFEYRKHKSEHDMNLIFARTLPKGYDMDFDLYFYNGFRDILSFFVQDNFQLTKDLSLFGDVQVVNHSFRIGNEQVGGKYRYYYNSNKEKVGGEGDLFDVKLTFINPRVGVNYKLNENMNMYAFAAHTSREPRMKNMYHATEALFGKRPMFEYQKVEIDGKEVRAYNFDNPNAKPEKMLDIELGANYFTDDFSVSANAYFMDYRDEFVKTGKRDQYGSSLDENAAKSRHYGIELSASAFAFRTETQFLSVWANATFSKNYFIEYDVFFDYPSKKEQTKVSLANNEISGFPSAMSNFGVNYKFHDLMVSLTGKYVGSFYTDNYNDMLRTNETIINALRNDWLGYYEDNVNDAYTAFDLDVSYTIKDISTSLSSIRFQFQVNNLLNNLYSYSGEGKEFFPAAERAFFFGMELGF